MVIDDTPSAATVPPGPATEAAVRSLLDNAARRTRFFSGPAAWLDEHATGDGPLLAAYAGALARELGEPAGTRPTWLSDRRPAGPSTAEPMPPTTEPLPGAGAQEIRMAAVAVVATVASVVSAVAAVVTAVVAVTNAMSATPAPRPKAA